MAFKNDGVEQACSMHGIGVGYNLKKIRRPMQSVVTQCRHY